MFKKPLFVVFLLLIILTFINYFSDAIEKKYEKPVLISFTPSTNPEEIEKVVFVTELNGWWLSDPQFFMKPDPEKKKYFISIKFPPGKTQYKFLIIKKDGSKIWLSDPLNKRKISDGFGGFNSIYYRKSLKSTKKVLNILIITFLSIYIFYFLARKIIYWLFYRHFRFRTKMLIMAVLINIIGMSFYFFIYINHTNQLLSTLLIQQANYVFQALKNVDYNDTIALEKTLDSFINSAYQMKFRVEKPGIIPINNIAIFENKELKLIVFNFAEKERVHNVYNLKTQPEFVKYATTHNWFPKKHLETPKPRLIKEDRIKRIKDALRNKRFFFEKLILNSEDVVYPIQDGRYHFWFFFSLDYLNDFTHIILNRFLLTVVIFLFVSVLLMYFLSEPIRDIIEKLKEGVNRVRSGDYRFSISINSGDEFEDLGNTFNNMIKDLRIKENLLPYISKAALDFASYKAETMSELQYATEKKLTIMFLDIVGFSQLSTTLSPNKLIKLLNEFYKEIEKIMTKHSGIIDKFIGDAIMAFFDSTEQCGVNNAIAAAKEIINTLNKKSWGNIKIAVRIGIDYGPVILGEIGAESGRRDFTCIGKIVNRAQRIQSKANPNAILISEDAYNCLAPKPDIQEKLTTTLKGFKQSVTIYLLKL